MSYQIHITPGNKTFAAEADEPVLEAALRAGVALPYGCRGGSCGACRATLLDGQLRYANEEPPDALSEQELSAGQALLCQAYAAGDVRLRVQSGIIEGTVVKNLPCRVVALNKLAPDVMQLLLKLPPSEAFRYQAGQYIDILLRDGRQRSFSLAGAPSQVESGEQPLELHVRHVPGGAFSGQVFETLREKTILRFQGPLGGFYLRQPPARPILMMAGGTGFAPIKAIVDELLIGGVALPPSIHFYWGVRALADLYQESVVRDWQPRFATAGLRFRYTPVLSEPRPEDDWSGCRGWVHDALADDYPDLSDYDVYMSGPPAMINAAKARFFAQGLNPERLYYDSFEHAGS